MKQIGKYWELPIMGRKVVKIEFSGLLALYFDDEEGSWLDLHGDFQVMQDGRTVCLSPRSKEGLLLCFEHFGQMIMEAKADKGGNLWLRFENGTEIWVEDGPFENWHYTKRNHGSPAKSLFVHGGVGKTVFF